MSHSEMRPSSPLYDSLCQSLDLCAMSIPGFGTRTSPDNLQTLPMNPSEIEGTSMFAAERIDGIVAIPDDDEDSMGIKVNGIQPELWKTTL